MRHRNCGDFARLFANSNRLNFPTPVEFALDADEEKQGGQGRDKPHQSGSEQNTSVFVIGRKNCGGTSDI